MHFSRDSFVIGNDDKLNNKAVPLPWTEQVNQDILKNADIMEEAVTLVDADPSSNSKENCRDRQTEKVEMNPGQENVVAIKTYRAIKLDFSAEDDENPEWMVDSPGKSESIEMSARKNRTAEDTLMTAQNRIAQLEKAQRRLKRQNDLLRRQIRRLRDRFKRMERPSQTKSNKGQKKKMCVDKFLDEQNCIQLAARTMVKLQLHEPRLPYSPEEKDLAKQLYYNSAAAYSRLRKAGCNFPGESSVRRWIAEHDIRCGFSTCIFEKLAEKLNQLPPDERVCALKWDEMHIKSCEEYSTMLDLIEGLEDLGPLGRRNARASSLFVFCLDSINAKNSWRQPIAFFLASNAVKAPEIKGLIKICLGKLKITGADVRILTCDQGPSNQTALMSPLHFNISESDQTFDYDGSTYCASFDFPHLIKRLLYQLRTNNCLYCKGEVIVAFEDFVDTWTIDARQDSSNLLGHISDVHLFPGSFEAMNVKRAFQVLSHTFACAIKLAGSDPNGLKSKTWEASASFAERLNDVIDAHNAYRLIFANPMRRPLAPRNPAIEKTLVDFADWVSNWSTSPDKVKRPPCFRGLVITARAIVKTYHQLAEDFPGFELAAGLCNQDSVEHLFSKVRQRGGHNANPTARMARLALRHIISTGYIHSGDKGNVQCPEAKSLIIASSDIARVFSESEDRSAHLTELFEEETESAERRSLGHDFELIDKNGGLASNDTSERSVYEDNAVTFFAGYIAFRMMKKNHCERCQNEMTKTPMEGSTADEMYIQFKEYENPDEDAPKVTKLTRPTDQFTGIVDVQLRAFTNVWAEHWPSNALMENMARELTVATNSAYPDWFQADGPCFDHRIAALKYLIRVKVYARTRSNNQAARIHKSAPAGNQQKKRKLMILKNC